jgi:hypothetical protein
MMLLFTDAARPTQCSGPARDPGDRRNPLAHPASRRRKAQCDKFATMRQYCTRSIISLVDAGKVSPVAIVHGQGRQDAPAGFDLIVNLDITSKSGDGE